MNAYFYSSVICPECDRIRIFSVMQAVLVREGLQVMTCTRPACPNYMVPFERPKVEIKPTDAINSEELRVLAQTEGRHESP